jgi:hypothetical protein
MYGEADRALRPCPRKARQSPDLTSAGRISFGIFFAETNGTQKHGECELEQVQGKPANRGIGRSKRPEEINRSVVDQNSAGR